MVGSSLCTTTVASGVASTTFAKKSPEEKLKELAVTSISTTAVTLTGQTINNIKMQEIYEKYSTAYVQSLNEEELAEVLEKLELLESEKTHIKTL